MTLDKDETSSLHVQTIWWKPQTATGNTHCERPQLWYRTHFTLQIVQAASEWISWHSCVLCCVLGLDSGRVECLQRAGGAPHRFKRLKVGQPEEPNRYILSGKGLTTHRSRPNRNWRCSGPLKVEVWQNISLPRSLIAESQRAIVVAWELAKQSVGKVYNYWLEKAEQKAAMLWERSCWF